MKRILTLSFLLFFCLAEHIWANESVVFAIDPTKPPMQFIDRNGDVAGFEIDLIKEMGRAVGFDPFFKQVSWEGIFQGLQAGEYDAVCASTSITEPRKKIMDFTVPYYTVAQVILIPMDSPIKEIRELRGKRVGVKKETTSLITIGKFPNINQVLYSSVPDALKALKEKQIDAVICDGPVAGYYAMVKKKSQLKVAFVLKQEKAELYGIALKKNNPALKSMLNKALYIVQKNNRDIELQNKWFSALLGAKQ